MFTFVKNILKKIVYKYIPAPQPLHEFSFSQAGEDRIIRWLFNDRGFPRIKYLDVGTNAPIDMNNTYLFYSSGSRGVCVEADPNLIQSIQRARPRDIVINSAVSSVSNKFVDLYVMSSTGNSTMQKSEINKRCSSGFNEIKEVVSIETISLNDVIKNNFDTCPDLLSLDIEGHDLEALQALDFYQYPIPVICVETCEYSENHVRPKDASIANFLTQNGYFIYADTYINTIFVNKAWFFRK